MTTTPPSLELRSQPTQARSRETFEFILAETASLLEEVGFDAFNTNLLSNRSGIGVRAIYRYFPNKFALVCELARRLERQWHDALAVVTVQNPNSSWLDIWPNYIDEYLAAVKHTPGGTAVLRAMRSNPELRAVDDEMTKAYKASVARSLIKNHPSLTLAEATNIATLLLHSTVAIVDISLDESRSKAKQLIADLKSMHASYLREKLT